jgi:hypothetical protein
MKNLLMINLFFAMLFAVSSCVMEDKNAEYRESPKKEERTLRNDKFYFKRYNKISEADSAQVINVSFNESGSIEIYGNIIRVVRTADSDMYRIMKEDYSLSNQTYKFTCDRAIVEFSVMDKTMTIQFMNSDNKEVYYIDSNINTNW